MKDPEFSGMWSRLFFLGILLVIFVIACFFMFRAGRFFEQRKQAPGHMLDACALADTARNLLMLENVISKGLTNPMVSREQRLAFVSWKNILSGAVFDISTVPDHLRLMMAPERNLFGSGVRGAVKIAAINRLTEHERAERDPYVLRISPVSPTEWRAEIASNKDSVVFRTVTIRFLDISGNDDRLLLSEPTLDVPEFPFVTPAPAHAEAPQVSAKENEDVSAAKPPTP